MKQMAETEKNIKEHLIKKKNKKKKIREGRKEEQRYDFYGDIKGHMGWQG
jgi:hypothetical protein